MNEKTALINADKLPEDVAGGEALLDRHQQHKVVNEGLFRRRRKKGRSKGEMCPECQIACCI